MEEMPAAIVDRPQGTGDFLLMMFHHQVQVLTDSGLVDVQPGGLMIWDRVDGHFYGNETSHWKHTWIHVNGSFVPKFIQDAPLPYRKPLYFSEAIFEETVRRMITELSHPGGYNPLILRNTFQNAMLRP